MMLLHIKPKVGGWEGIITYVTAFCKQLSGSCRLKNPEERRWSHSLKINTDRRKFVDVFSWVQEWVDHSTRNDPLPRFEAALRCDIRSKVPVWLRQLERSSASCPRTTMGTSLEGLAGKIVGVQWQFGDFSHVKGSSHPKEKHTTTNKEHPWPDNEPLWVWSF